jgi:hypothetical protein
MGNRRNDRGRPVLRQESSGVISERSSGLEIGSRNRLAQAFVRFEAINILKEVGLDKAF